MGIKALLHTAVSDEMDDYEEPILPCVKSALKLNYSGNKHIRKHDQSYRLSEYMDLDEYIF